MGTTVLLILFIIIGFLVSIVLFLIGFIRVLLKKGWKLVWISMLLFVLTIVVYMVAQRFYMQNVHPSVIQNLQQNPFNNK